MFLDNKTYNWPLTKTIILPRQRVGCVSFFESELHLGRSKEFNNEGIKVQVNRTLKSYSFSSLKKRENKQADSTWNLPEPCVLVCSRCFNNTFQNQYPLILLSPLFQAPHLDQQNAKQALSLTKELSITLKNTSSNISIDLIWLSSLHKFY